MADISITQEHQLTQMHAKAAAQQIADQIAAEYDVSLVWKDEVLFFERSGVSGRLAVLETEALLEISLGGFMKAFAPMIEDKVARKMKKVFGGGIS